MNSVFKTQAARQKVDLMGFAKTQRMSPSKKINDKELLNHSLKIEKLASDA